MVSLKEGDAVLFNRHAVGVWDLQYSGDYRIMSFPWKTQVEMIDLT